MVLRWPTSKGRGGRTAGRAREEERGKEDF